MKEIVFLGIVLSLSVFFVGGCFAEKNVFETMEESAEDLLPTTSDLSSEWILDEISDVLIKDQAEGKAESIKKTDGSIMLITVLKFVHVELASSYYDGIVEELKEKKEFEESAIPDFKSTCLIFEYGFRSPEKNKAKIVCKNKYFYFAIDGPKNIDDLKYIANIIDRKI